MLLIHLFSAEEVQKSLKKEKKKFAEIEELYQKVRGVFLEENAELEKSCSELEQELQQLNEILEKQRQVEFLFKMQEM